MNSYIYIAITVLSTVISQVSFKFASKNTSIDLFNISAILNLFFNIYIIIGLLFSIISILSWIICLSKMPLSQAYPFMSLSFPLVLIMSYIIFREPVGIYNFIGMLLVISGLFFVQSKVRMRFLPAAITPLSPLSVFRAMFSSRAGVDNFEKLLAIYFNKRYAFTFQSLMRTTYACFVGLSRCCNKKKVILPRYSCPSFTHGVVAAGLEIVYCDVDPLTLAIDIEGLKKINLADVLAIVCTNLFGLTSDVNEIRNIVHKSNVYVIEGVDYGIGTVFKGKPIGTSSDVTILNFQEGKALPIGGGAIVTDMPQYDQLFGSGRPIAKPNFLTMVGFSIFSKPFFYWVLMKMVFLLGFSRKKLSMEDTIRTTKSEFDFRFNPANYELSVSNFQGRLGVEEFKNLERNLKIRAGNADFFASKIAPLKSIKIIEPINGVEVVHYIRLPILVLNGKRDELLKIFLEQNIEASPMYIEHGLSIDEQQYPGSYKVLNQLLTIPCHPYVKQADRESIVKILNDFEKASGVI